MNLKKKILITITFLLMIIFFQVNISKATTVTVTTDTLNLRREASTDSDIILQLLEGDECELIEEDGNWYKVSYGDYTGYISKDYAEVESDSSDTNETSTETTTTTSSQTGEGTINETASLRIAPLVNSSVLEVIKSGTQVTVITQTGDWLYIYTDDTAGWVRSDVVTVETQSVEEDTSESEEQETSTSEDETTDDTTDTTEETTEENSDFEEKTMYTTDIVNIREEASTDSEVIMIVNVNTKLTVIGEEGDWYKVETSKGEAYVSKDLLSDEETTTDDE